MDEEPLRTKRDAYSHDMQLARHPGLNFFPLSLTPTNLYLKQLCDDMARLHKKIQGYESYIFKCEMLSQQLFHAEKLHRKDEMKIKKLKETIKKLKTKK